MVDFNFRPFYFRVDLVFYFVVGGMMLNFFRKHRLFISKALFVTLAFSFMPSFLSAAVEEQKASALGIFEKISELYMPSLISAERDEVKKENKVMGANELPMRVGNVDALNLTYGILSSPHLQEMFGEFKRNQLLDDCVLTDLEIFCGSEGGAGGLFSKIDYTRTPFGKAKLQSLFLQKFDDLGDSVNNVIELQRKVKYLVENEELFKRIDTRLVELKDILGDVLWLWKPMNDASTGFLDQVFFPKLDVTLGGKNHELDLTMFNKNSMMLSSYFAYSTWIALIVVSLWYFYRDLMRGREADNILNEQRLSDYAKALHGDSMGSGCLKEFQDAAGFVQSICPALKIGKYQFLLGVERANGFLAKYGIFTALTTALLGMYIYKSYIDFSKFHKVFKAIHAKMNKLSIFYGGMVEFEESLGGIDIFADLLSVHNKNKKKLVSFDQFVAFEKLFKDLISSKQYKNPSFFLGKGKSLADFKKFLSLKSNLVSSLLLIGEIDMLMSIAKLYKFHVRNERAKYCFAEFVKADLPYINIKNFWHPMITPEDAVPNDIELGTPKAGRGVILTGPNAAGKSSALKGIILSIILSQTIGIAPASSIQITPFTRICSHLNVSDAQGRESLFQAEMNRSLKFLGDVKKLNKNEFMFVILDELFSSTNPEEGMSGAYGIVKSLADTPLCMSVLATHFKKITELESKTNGYFKNYKVYVDVFPDGSFKRPFKFIPGISDQSMALLLMHKHGFGKQIVDDAFGVLAQVKDDRRSIIMPQGYNYGR